MAAGGVDLQKGKVQGPCRAAVVFLQPPHAKLRVAVERAMLIGKQTPMNMKSTHANQPNRNSRRNPWSSKNIRLLRAALRVWELKQRAR